MDKRSVLRLKFGDCVIVGDPKRRGQAGEAGVIRVTPKGGVLVRLIMTSSYLHLGPLQWYPYHHVLHKSFWPCKELERSLWTWRAQALSTKVPEFEKSQGNSADDLW